MTNRYTMFDYKHTNFALGTPRTNDMPTEIINDILRNITLTNDMLQYGYVSGFRDVRVEISEFMKRYSNLDVEPDTICMTTGISQTLFLLCHLLTHEGDTIFVDELTYFAAIDMFKEFKLRIEVVSHDTFETKLQTHKPVFYYHVPYYNNPTGVSKTRDEMNEIYRLANIYDFFVLNDNIYEYLGFETHEHFQITDKCINLYSCSKMIAPALKVGWIVANSDIIHKISKCALLQSGGALNPMNYVVLHELMRTRKFDVIIEHWKHIMASRKQTMVHELRKYADITFVEPTGGYFVWVAFGSNFITSDYFMTKQLFHPGSKFAYGDKNTYNNYIRLCYAFYNEDEIHQGIADLFAHVETYKRQQLDEILRVIPVVPFKGIEKFYDINGLLNCPAEFKMAMDLIVEHCQTVDFDIIGCIDARGFLFGPVIGMALNKPVFMFRKNGKMPNSIVGDVYSKEYKSDTDGERLSISDGLIGEKYKKVLIIDDLAATGGTFIAAANLISYCGGEVVECACVIELQCLNARQKLNDKGIPLWGLISR